MFSLEEVIRRKAAYLDDRQMKTQGLTDWQSFPLEILVAIIPRTLGVPISTFTLENGDVISSREMRLMQLWQAGRPTTMDEERSSDLCKPARLQL